MCQKKPNPEETTEATVVSFLENGCYLVEKNNKLNITNKEGELVSDYWFSYLQLMDNGIFKVQKDKQQWNFMNQQGELLVRNIWFDFVGDFRNGLARVKKLKLWNFINEQGELINACWFDLVSDFQANGLALVKQHKTWYFLDKQAKLTKIKLPRMKVWFTKDKKENDNLQG